MKLTDKQLTDVYESGENARTIRDKIRGVSSLMPERYKEAHKLAQKIEGDVEELGSEINRIYNEDS